METTSIARYYDLPDSTESGTCFQRAGYAESGSSDLSQWKPYPGGSCWPVLLLPRLALPAIENRDEYVWNNVDVNGTRWSEVIVKRYSRTAWRELTLKGRQ